MSFLEELQGLYRDTLLHVEVPEWNGLDGQEEFFVYFYPLTVKEQKEMIPYASKQDPQAFIELIIQKALKENGEHLFERSKATRETLLGSVSNGVVMRIANAMMDIESKDDLKKSSRETLTFSGNSPSQKSLGKH